MLYYRRCEGRNSSFFRKKKTQFQRKIICARWLPCEFKNICLVRKNFFLFVICLPAVLLAQHGMIDKSFGKNGFAIAPGDYTLYNPGTPSMVIQPDGKILTVATKDDHEEREDDVNIHIIVNRFTAKGFPDSSFNNKGFLIIKYKDAFTWGRAIGLQ